MKQSDGVEGNKSLEKASFKHRIKRSLKERPRLAAFIAKPILQISLWQYSKFPPFRWLAKLVSIPLYTYLRDDYYKAVLYLRKASASARSNYGYSRFAPQLPLLRAVTGDKSITADIYKNYLGKVHLEAEQQYEWGRRFIEVGRLDLAHIALLDVKNRTEDRLPHHRQLGLLRLLGAICFMLGYNAEANTHWELAGQVRRAMFKPKTPRGYRILGPSWSVAIGHVAMLDYYLKFKRLYGNQNQRIVVHYDAQIMQNLAGRELFEMFESAGINFLNEGEIEDDYNEWAGAMGAPLWTELSLDEKEAMVDDFWEYDFPDGQILGYAHAAARIQQEWEAREFKPLLILDDNEREWIKNYIVNLGLPRDAWYVCLHVREPGFHKQWNAIYPSMRDADISDYVPAIKAITDAGGWVLRMGDPTMKPLPDMERVVDYAHSPCKTKMGDILLAAGCRFFLGTNSGYATIPAIYNTRCVLTNWVPLGWPLWPKQDLMLPKLFKEKTTGRHLSVQEIFEKELGFIQNWHDLPAGIELTSNTPDEIMNATREMMNQCGIAVQEARDLRNDLNQGQEYYAKIAESHGAFTGSQISQTFIEKHPEVFNLHELKNDQTEKEIEPTWHAQSNDNMTATLS